MSKKMKTFNWLFLLAMFPLAVWICQVAYSPAAAPPDDFQGAVKQAAQRVYSTRDDVSNALTTVTFAHHEIHEGDMYRLQYTQDSITTDNDETAVVFSTPAANGKHIHLIAEGFAEDYANFRLIETPSVDEGEATAVSVPFNKDRTSSNTSGLFDAEPVKATGGVIEWTGVAQELDSFSIGDDIYLITQLEATATAANPNAFWIDLGDAAAATMDGVAIIAIDAAQATSNNDQTVEASQGAGTTVDLDADGFGDNGNLAVTIIVGANMAAGVDLTGGVGAPNTGKDAEIHGAVNSVSVYAENTADTANITTTVSLINDTFGAAAATPAQNQQAGHSRDAQEWVLAPGTQYCVYIQSLNGGDQVHTIILTWYEHTDSN